MKGRTLPKLAFNSDGSAVVFDEPERGGQTQPETLAHPPRRKKRLENPFLVFLINSHSGIRNG